MQFDDWLNNEKYELELAIGGCENMANFQYSNTESQGLKNLVFIILKDVAVRQFRQAYNKEGWLWDTPVPDWETNIT